MTWRPRLSSYNILLLGCGAIGEQMLEILRREVPNAISRVTVIDAMPCKKNLVEAIGANFRYGHLTASNVGSILAEYVKQDTVVINATVQVLTSAVIRICQDAGALYIDTSNETWPEGGNASATITADRLQRMDALKRELSGGPTALICHGANPGLITHFVKQALCSVAASQGRTIARQNGDNWGELARELGLVSVHLSELDSQFAPKANLGDKFANTWSVAGFLEEANEPVHFAWGTSETIRPKNAEILYTSNDLRMVRISRKAHEAVIRSWIPSQGTFDALPIPHPEVFTIADMLRSTDDNGDTQQPTVLFAYRPSLHCLASLRHAGSRTGTPYIVKHELTDGWDELGALLIFRDGNTFWYGSRLRVTQSRLSTPHGNATIQQVCAGILGGLAWIMAHPKAGLVQAEDIDHETVLDVARPYLGLLNSIKGRWLNLDGSPPWPTAPLLRLGDLEEHYHWPEPRVA